MFIIVIYMVTLLKRKDENEKKWKKYILKILKILKFKIRHDREEIKQNMNQQQNNQTLSMYQISPCMTPY